MSIDELGRAAATEARRNAAHAVDTDVMLRRLDRLRRRRTAGSIIGALAVAAAVVAGGVAIAHENGTSQHNKSASTATSTSTPKPTGLCADPNLRCLGGDEFRIVALPVPVTVAMPANFHRAFSVSNDGIEVYRKDVSSTGVAVTENAVAAKYGPPSWERDPAAGTTAASMARWLAHRPFLIHTTLTRTTVGGLPAWQVSGDLKPGAVLSAPKLGGNVAPTFGRAYNASFGYRADLTGRYTLIDVPGAGVTVIWSWTLDHGERVLAGNQRLIDGVAFG